METGLNKIFFKRKFKENKLQNRRLYIITAIFLKHFKMNTFIKLVK